MVQNKILLGWNHIQESFLVFPFVKFSELFYPYHGRQLLNGLTSMTLNILSMLICLILIPVPGNQIDPVTSEFWIQAVNISSRTSVILQFSEIDKNMMVVDNIFTDIRMFFFRFFMQACTSIQVQIENVCFSAVNSTSMIEQLDKPSLISRETDISILP